MKFSKSSRDYTHLKALDEPNLNLQKSNEKRSKNYNKILPYGSPAGRTLLEPAASHNENLVILIQKPIKDRDVV
ncbi:hypothetical protein B9Z55_004960 [Caenorhabditis nigoni]|nr:hypothetical protein B9Z55_004960 [Caenorhabditis nigoni]